MPQRIPIEDPFLKSDDEKDYLFNSMSKKIGFQYKSFCELYDKWGDTNEWELIVDPPPHTHIHILLFHRRLDFSLKILMLSQKSHEPPSSEYISWMYQS